MFGSAPDWLVLAEVAIFTIGAMAFTVVLFLVRRAAWRQQVVGGSTRAETAIALNSVVYCLCNVAIGVVTLGGGRPGWGLVTGFTVCTYLYPPLIIADTLAGDARRARVHHRAIALVHALVWTASLGLSGFVAGLYFDLWNVPVPRAFFNVTIGTLFLVAIGVAFAVERQRRLGADRHTARPEARWIFRLFAAAAGLSLLLMLHGTTLRSGSYALSLTTRLLPLAFLVAGAWADGRAAFYDLLVKRMLLAVLAMLGLAAAVALTRPAVAGLEAWQAAWLTGILLAPIVLALLGAGRVLSNWLDTRWLGRHYSPGEAVEHVLEATRESDDRGDVEHRGLQAIGDIFDGTATLVPVAAAPADASRHVGQAPVEAGLRVVVARRDESRPFYSGDLALLQSVARVLGLELGRVALERERQAEAARALRAQVNPHFLFNALNTIGGWVHADPARAEAIVEQLSEVFRYTLRGTTAEWVEVDAELAAVRRYLEVERARFGERLHAEVTVDGAARQAAVPPLLVLTLAENAVKHGVATSTTPVSIRVHAALDGGMLRIDVADTGPGLDASSAATDAADDGGFGLASVRARLRLQCGPDASLEGRRDEARGETRFTLRLPVTLPG